LKNFKLFEKKIACLNEKKLKGNLDRGILRRYLK